jgi:hypothetical protein
MASRSIVFGLLLVSILGTHCASTPAPPPDADDLQMVDCRLAPKVKRIGRTTLIVPGRLVRITAVDCRVRGGLDLLARKSIPASLNGLHALPCGEARCYSSREVAGAMDRIREQVRQVLPRQAAALALAIDADLDRASRLAEPLPLNAIQPAQLRPDNATSGYRTDVVADVFHKLAEVIDHVLSYDSLSPTLTISSNPDSANFVMYVGGVEITKRSCVTNNMLPNVWRGVYAAEVRKKGYKRRSQTIDLMNEGGTRIYCTLASERDDEDSVCKVQQ